MQEQTDDYLPEVLDEEPLINEVFDEKYRPELDEHEVIVQIERVVQPE